MTLCRVAVRFRSAGPVRGPQELVPTFSSIWFLALWAHLWCVGGDHSHCIWCFVSESWFGLYFSLLSLSLCFVLCPLPFVLCPSHFVLALALDLALVLVLVFALSLLSSVSCLCLVCCVCVCLVISCLVISCHVMSCLVTSCHALSCPVIYIQTHIFVLYSLCKLCIPVISGLHPVFV